MAGGNILSFKAELVSVLTTSAIINLTPLGPSSAIIYMAFSVIVITQNNSFLELLTVVKSNLIDYSEFTNYFEVSSSKFTFDSSSFQVDAFIQWITTVNNDCGNQKWYWTMLRVEVVNGTSVVRVPYYQDNDIDKIKVNIIIVSQQIAKSQKKDDAHRRDNP